MEREIKRHGHRVRLDLSTQVIALDIPESSRGARSADAPIAPVLPLSEARGFVSAAMLAQKAKQFDDGLYAAADLLVIHGAGARAGRRALLASLAARLAASPRETSAGAAAIVGAACSLAGIDAAWPSDATPSIDEARRAFLRDELRSKPIGFYTWSPELARVFQTDRMLQTPLEPHAAIALARALHEDAALRREYEAQLTLASRLTNPFARSDLRPFLAALDLGAAPSPAGATSLLPPSIAPETELVKQLYGDRSVPPGFVLVDEVMRRVRSGELDLTPARDAGWYAHQLYAYEPLLVPDRCRESRRLKTRDGYRRYLDDLFKALFALTRETHIKQLEIVGAATGAPIPVVRIAPELTVEPLATHYQRRALAYRFVREVLDDAFGPAALASTARLTAAGPVRTSLADELAAMERLFWGACATAWRELGEEPTDALGDAWRGGDPDIAAHALDAFRAGLPRDPDLAVDARMMVPVYFDLARNKTRVWVFLGWTTEPLEASFVARPRVIPGPHREPVKPEFVPAHHTLARPVTAEVSVTRLLDRDEFRRHCDRHRTRAAILANLV